jgi:hypothetical protein
MCIVTSMNTYAKPKLKIATGNILHVNLFHHHSSPAQMLTHPQQQKLGTKNWTWSIATAGLVLNQVIYETQMPFEKEKRSLIQFRDSSRNMIRSSEVTLMCQQCSSFKVVLPWKHKCESKKQTFKERMFGLCNYLTTLAGWNWQYWQIASWGSQMLVEGRKTAYIAGCSGHNRYRCSS